TSLPKVRSFVCFIQQVFRVDTSEVSTEQATANIRAMECWVYRVMRLNHTAYRYLVWTCRTSIGHQRSADCCRRGHDVGHRLNGFLNVLVVTFNVYLERDRF